MFLKEEVRCGFKVTEEAKAVWKVQLDILEEIIRICEKYRIRYCMIAGSLLGAIRHKGFIPWDDDIDVAMPRPDYDRFVEVAASELRSPHCFMNVVTDPEWNTDYAQIRNSETAMISPFWTNKKARMNHGIMVDVFCLDGVCPRRLVRRVQNLMMRLLRSVNWCAFYHGNGWRALVKPFAWLVYEALGGKGWCRIRRWVLNWCPFERSEACGSIGFLFEEPRFQWPTRCFKEFVNVPFEYLTVKVPKDYDEMLTKSYGDWHKFVRGGALHENLCVDPYRNYKEILVEKYGYKPEWLR